MFYITLVYFMQAYINADINKTPKFQHEELMWTYEGLGCETNVE